MTQERRSSISQRRVFTILSLAHVLRPSLIPAIEYNIPFMTINNTLQSAAMSVKYLIIPQKSSITLQNPDCT